MQTKIFPQAVAPLAAKSSGGRRLLGNQVSVLLTNARSPKSAANCYRVDVRVSKSVRKKAGWRAQDMVMLFSTTEKNVVLLRRVQENGFVLSKGECASFPGSVALVLGLRFPDKRKRVFENLWFSGEDVFIDVS